MLQGELVYMFLRMSENSIMRAESTSGGRGVPALLMHCTVSTSIVEWCRGRFGMSVCL
jgi:hypothetical protein